MQSPEYQKLGPGYSVISSENVNQSNENFQLFKDLAQSIEETMNEDIADINKEVLLNVDSASRETQHLFIPNNKIAKLIYCTA